ncbi:hypothetical protein G9A89_019920 [Geosiphon pyriformis]|nr:hypothetical protein G9A89_019920 [Geosiphon pyriformis]
MHLVFIYAKKQASMSHLIFFGDQFRHDSLMPAVIILALYISVLKCSLENVFDQMADISHKLDKLLAVLSVDVSVFSTLKHNLMLDMAVDTLLFIPPVSGVITAIFQDISPSGSQVLTVKVGGLEANLVVLENSVKAILNNLGSFRFGSGVVTPSLPQ